QRISPLAAPAIYSIFRYADSYAMHFEVDHFAEMETFGVLNALRFATKNLLTIIETENRSIDWDMHDLVIPLASPLTVSPGEVVRDLVALLAHYRATPPGADRWHVVIAGDFIDFIGMTIAPREALETELTDEERDHGLGGAADHAREKLRRVARRHADIFAEL